MIIKIVRTATQVIIILICTYLAISTYREIQNPAPIIPNQLANGILISDGTNSTTLFEQSNELAERYNNQLATTQWYVLYLYIITAFICLLDIVSSITAYKNRSH